MKLKKLNDYCQILLQEGKMNTDGHIYAHQSIKIEDKALEQLKNACELPGVVQVIATPDIHTGYGVPIGSVVATPSFISPSAVGYDINCGMRLLKTPLFRDELNEKSLKKIAHSINRDIPLGEGKSNVKLQKRLFEEAIKKGLRGYSNVAENDSRLSEFFSEELFNRDINRVEDNGSMECEAKYISQRALDRGKNQLGTLGGGNHFIEIQEIISIENDSLASFFGIKEGQITVMIHSGSRGFGHQIADDYMKRALKYCNQHGLDFPNKELTYFLSNSDEANEYYDSMKAAANFAFLNRQIMADLVRKNFHYEFGKDCVLETIYDVPHNIVKSETHRDKSLWVHRKGATRAFNKERMSGTPFETIGQPVIIPGSMGTFSYLLIGVDGGDKTLFSINHGAGRVMSRIKAGGKITRSGKIVKEGIISNERFKETMEGIQLVCENKRTIKEEAPDAYKDIDLVIESVVKSDLSEIVAKMKPLAVLKG